MVLDVYKKLRIHSPRMTITFSYAPLLDTLLINSANLSTSFLEHLAFEPVKLNINAIDRAPYTKFVAREFRKG